MIKPVQNARLLEVDANLDVGDSLFVIENAI
jgi:hypothetical protein